jgi:hypothetical protein
MAIIQMAPRATPKESDPHSKRIIFDMIEWHERLERLAEMRRRAPTSAAKNHGDSADTRGILAAEGAHLEAKKDAPALAVHRPKTLQNPQGFSALTDQKAHR